MSADPRRRISSPFGSPRGEISLSTEGEVLYFKTAFVNDPAEAANSVLRTNHPELLKRCADDDSAFIYWPWYREVLIPVLDGGPSAVVIDYDPFTGTRLPPSLRDAWFDTIEHETGREVGLFDDGVPEEFQSETWWVNRKL